jgi:XisH protein
MCFTCLVGACVILKTGKNCHFKLTCQKRDCFGFFIQNIKVGLKYDFRLHSPPTMSAKDRYHNAVRNALLKEKWKLTDPLILKFENEDEVRIDLGAERLLIANRGQEKIAVEVKSFLSESALFDYHAALGQFLNYRERVRNPGA